MSMTTQKDNVPCVVFFCPVGGGQISSTVSTKDRRPLKREFSQN